MTDFNVDISISNSGHGKLELFCSLFNLKFLIKKETCVTKTHKSTINFNKQITVFSIAVLLKLA